MSMDQQNKQQYIIKTQQRLQLFGISNLRTYEVFSLRRVAVSDGDIEQSPLLDKARMAWKLSQDQQLKQDEKDLIQMMKDCEYEDILNPNEVPNSVLFDDYAN